MANIKCPKCKSLNIEIMGQKKKGFSVGKAIFGSALAGNPAGALVGFIGSGKKYDVYCKDCGHKWRVK